MAQEPGRALATSEPRARRSLSSEVARLQAEIVPADPGKAVSELTACIALAALGGMDDNDRAEWIAVAQQTVGHYPPDILEIACREARRTCDHPAKIVPAIVKAADPLLARRRAYLRQLEEAARPKSLPRDIVEPQHIGALVKAIGRGPKAVEQVIQQVERRPGS